jgi:integrase
MWEEIDLQKAVWSIPASRMKAKKPHNVPLSKRAIDLLQQASALSDGETGLVFPSPISGKQLSDMTLSKLLKELNIAAVPHGFRSSFRDWAGEQTNIPREVAEFCLAHVTKDKTEAAYARSDLFEKRRKLMDAWEGYLMVSEVKVVRLGGIKCQ